MDFASRGSCSGIIIAVEISLLTEHNFAVNTDLSFMYLTMCLFFSLQLRNLVCIGRHNNLVIVLRSTKPR